jgi:hypothetical protein
MFSAPRLIFGGTGCVGSLFHVLSSRTRFRRYGGRRVPFSCFAIPYSYSAVPRVTGPVFIFCALELFFGGTEGAESRFHFLSSRTCSRWYRGRQVPILCFELPNSFSAVPRASGPVFLFCDHGLVFGGTEGAGSRFLFLRALSRFLRYRWRRIPFSGFALPFSFSAVPRESGPVFMFSALGLVFGGTEGVGSRFHVLHAQTRFRRY